MRTHPWAIRLAAMALLGVSLGACRSNFVAISPRPPERFVELGKTYGSACGLLLFGVIPIGVNSRVANAYREATRRALATDLTDTSVSDKWYIIPLVGLVQCTELEGTAIRPEQMVPGRTPR
jgi:hypothetical protein